MKWMANKQPEADRAGIAGLIEHLTEVPSTAYSLMQLPYTLLQALLAESPLFHKIQFSRIRVTVMAMVSSYFVEKQLSIDIMSRP